MYENKPLMVEDEIDLRELFQILWKKRLFIIIFTIFITIIAIIYAYLKAPIYQVKSYIEIGYIDKQAIGIIENLEQRLKVIFMKDLKDKDFSKGVVTSINKEKGVKNFLEITTEAFSNDIALELNQEVLKFIQSYFKIIIEEYIDFIDSAIFEKQKELNVLQTYGTSPIKEMEDVSNISHISLENKISFYTKNLEKYSNEIEKLTKKSLDTQNTQTSMYVSMQVLNYQNLIINTQSQIINTQNQINRVLQLTKEIRELSLKKAEYNLSNAKLVGGYFVDDLPVKPKKLLIVAVASITGLILSIFMVFFLNFIRKEQA